MKKIFRMAAVFALACATLLYTGCTKDYSEDLSKLESRVDAIEGTAIKTLKEQVAALESAKTELENAKKAANDAIAELQGKVSSLENAKTSLESAVKNLQTEIAKKADKSEVEALEDKLTSLQNEVNALKEAKATIENRISSLETKVGGLDDAIKKINEDLAKKADKSYVDDELAKKADKDWVESTLETYATIKYVDDKIASVNGEIKTIKNDINSLKGRMATAEEWIMYWQGIIPTLQTNLKNAQDAIKALQSDMDTAKTNITNLQTGLGACRSDLNDAMSDIQEIQEALELIYTKKEVDEIVKNINEELAKKVDNETFVAELAKKLDIESYKADTAALNKTIAKIENSIQQIITDYKAADEALQGQIDDLKKDVDDLKTTKLDKTTFEEYVENMEEVIEGIEANIEKLLNRVQSLVYVPKYASHNIPLNYAVFYSENEKAEMLQPTEVAGEFIYPEESIPATSHVKYRVYGVDASTIVTNLVAAVNKEIADGADSSAILSFDVVRVASKLNLDDVAVWVVGAEVDDMNPDIIDLTVKTVGLGDDFFFSRSVRSQKAEEFTYSMSLVLTDEEASRLITAEYWPIVPGDCTEIEVDIFDNDGANKKSIAGTLAETIELPYNYAEDTLLLKDHVVLFDIDGESYTYEELVAAGYDVPAITGKIVENPDFTDAIDETKIKADPYFVVDPKEGEASIESYASLAENCFGAVGAVDSVAFVYTFGYFTLPTSSKIVITPVKVAVEADLWESETLEPFTWNYKKDAASDLDSEDDVLNERDTVFVSFDEAAIAAAFAEAGIEFADFDHKVPANFKVYVADADADPEQLTATLDIPGTLPSGFEEVEGVNIEPFFVDGVLSANVTGFEFGKVYYYEAIYELPGFAADKECAVEVTVTGKFTTADRDREPIVITLPDSLKNFEANFNWIVKDILENAEVVKTFPEHSLTNEDVIDAFSKEFEQIDSVTIVVEGEPVTEAVSVMRIETKPEAENILEFYTNYYANNSIVAGKEFNPDADFVSYVTLWYGQEVIIYKSIKVNVDGIYDYERINEYVYYTDPTVCYTTLQPWWQPDGTTVDYTLPVSSYDAHEVLLDQHFRIVECATGEVCTNLDGTIKDEYNFLQRVFKLEEDGEQVDEIADPRNVEEITVPAATGVKIADDVLEYYSESPEEDVIGNLSVVNENGSSVVLTTKFNRAPAVGEDYSNYVVKVFDPLKAIECPEETQKINVNNSIITSTSIYQFISLKDKRGWETIDAENNGWVLGDDENGFAAGIAANEVYSMIFTNDIEYVTEVSPETQSRIKFDKETGILTYDNTLQTQLATPIDIKLSINVEYPWGTRTATVTVEFYNKPVGE